MFLIYYFINLSVNTFLTDLHFRFLHFVNIAITTQTVNYQNVESSEVRGSRGECSKADKIVPGKRTNSITINHILSSYRECGMLGANVFLMYLPSQHTSNDNY